MLAFKRNILMLIPQQSCARTPTFPQIRTRRGPHICNGGDIPHGQAGWEYITHAGPCAPADLLWILESICEVSVAWCWCDTSLRDWWCWCQKWRVTVQCHHLYESISQLSLRVWNQLDIRKVPLTPEVPWWYHWFELRTTCSCGVWKKAPLERRRRSV